MTLTVTLTTGQHYRAACDTIMLFVRTWIASRRPQQERHVHVLQSAQQMQMHLIIDITLVDFLLVHISYCEIGEATHFLCLMSGHLSTNIVNASVC